MSAVALFAVFLALMALGIPMVVTLAATAGFALLMSQGLPSTTLIQSAIFGIDKYVLLAVPLFILTGELMNASGIAKRLFDLASALVGHFRGGLAQVNILASVFVAGISGSAASDAALSSKIILPSMVARGYHPGFAGATVASSSILSTILPPSILLILYGAVANVSIGALFIAAIIPGFMLAAVLIGTVALISIKRGYKEDRARSSGKEILKLLVDASWALALPVIILVGLRFGIFTPTEAGAVAATFAAFVGLFVYRTIRLADLPRILSNAAVDTGMIMLVVAAAASFTFYLTILQIPQLVAQHIALYGNSALLFLTLCTLMLLLAGMMMEATALLLLAVPIFAPIAMRLGIDPVHFGLVVVLTVTIGTLTPPFAQLAFIVSSISRIPVEEIFKELMLILPGLLLVLAVVMYWPESFMWWLRLLY